MLKDDFALSEVVLYVLSIKVWCITRFLSQFFKSLKMRFLCAI